MKNKKNTDIENYQLVKKAQDGDMKAFNEIVRIYNRNVLGIITNFRFGTDDAKDIYQEVLIRVYKGLKNFKFNSEFSTWLFRITTNVCLTFKSKEKDKETISLSELYESSLSEDEHFVAEKSINRLFQKGMHVEHFDLSKHTEKALYRLPVQQRLAFILKFYQDYKIKEIAELMDVAEGTVKRYIFDATIRMKQLLSNLQDYNSEV